MRHPGLLRYTVLDRALIEQSERDYTSFLTGYSLYGHYGFGHFLLCFDSDRGYTDECAEARVQADPGAFGYFPWLDRKNGYWAQVVAYEHGVM